MTLKYAGPKELISAHGISFKKGKDDKYTYIYPAILIYEAIHHDYDKGVVYTYNVQGKRISDRDILNKISILNPNLEENIKKEISKTIKYLDDEIRDVKTHKVYNKEEQRVYKNNLIMMKDYRIQRETNKILYKLLVKKIVDDIFENKIKVINSPFNERYWHTLQTIQGELSNHNKRSIDSTLDIVHKDKEITISLKISSIGK